ncbi:GNAT family N-acetyltransferase [Aquabacterium sp.]|uniref:GNAT family N-acetyltransferase n=1 Tax=Aquabacterium sp. TaxID=1872578 RepID=UPI002E33F92E|nr:GNAT family N-acetyltransferase [Aquabacterium sp.]HEX5310785.1 GNAT family N-acetyltransferase [Aquabacterium sp.]
MQIETNNRGHLAEFVRLNELWIAEHFSIEQADRDLAADPGKIIDNGGFVFSLSHEGPVVGVCALFKESDERFQLARMAVDPAVRGKGYGRALIEHAIAQATLQGAKSLYLLSNTVLAPAISLYEQFDFRVTARGQQPVYARCNIVMERTLPMGPRHLS